MFQRLAKADAGVEAEAGGIDAAAVVAQVQAQALAGPALYSLGMAGDPALQQILLKAVAKDPDERYSSAEAFAEDLQRFLAREPIRARRPSFVARSSKWARRHVGFVSSLALLLLVGLAAASFAYWNTERERLKTQAALEQSEANFELALAAIDDMYVQFATRWIARDSASSD